MKAIFKGADFSMRLRHGKSYSLKYEELGFWRRLFNGFKFKVLITVYRGPRDYVLIPYSRTYTFLKNWHVYDVDESQTITE